MASLSSEESITSENGTASDDITVHEVSKTKSFDATFSTQTWREDTTLIVQGKRLYVSSSILSVVSPVFTAMFEEAFGGDRPREIVLKEKKYEDIVEFLLCIYPNVQKTVDSDNVCVVLPLAVEYDTQLLREKCKDFLSSHVTQETKLESMCLYLRTACTFEMSDIKETCIKKLSDSDYSEFRKAEESVPLPIDTKVEIQHRKLVFLEKSNELFQKILKNVNINKLWFSDSVEILKEFENGSVGYLEYSVCIPDKGKNAESPSISVHDIDWNIHVARSDDANHLSFSLKATSLQQQSGWSCRAYAMLTLCKTEGEPLCRSYDHVFAENEMKWGWSKFIPLVKLWNTQQKFLDNNRVQLEIKFVANKPLLKKDQ